MSDNDTLILELQKKIESKKKELKTSERFTPITNCSLELCGQRYNLHVASRDVLTFLLVQLSLYNEEAHILEVDLEIGGFSVGDWFEDVKAKLAHVNRSQEIQKLNAMEARLKALLSDEKKTALEIADIVKMLED